MTNNQALLKWIKEMTELCQPDRVVWCDGSQEEYDRLLQEMVSSGAATPLNPEKRPVVTFSAATRRMWPGWKTGLILPPKPGRKPAPPTTGLIPRN